MQYYYALCLKRLEPGIGLCRYLCLAAGLVGVSAGGGQTVVVAPEQVPQATPAATVEVGSI